MIGDLVAARSRDVLDRDGKVSNLEGPVGDGLDRSISLDKDAPSARIDHYLRDRRVHQEIFDRSKERQDPIEAAHSAPRSR